MSPFDRITFTDEERIAASAQWARFRVFAEEALTPLPDGREKSLALTKLQECLFWCEAARTVEAKRLRAP